MSKNLSEEFDCKVPSDFYMRTMFQLVINDKRIPEDLRCTFYELRERYHAELEQERDRMNWIKPEGYFRPMDN